MTTEGLSRRINEQSAALREMREELAKAEARVAELEAEHPDWMKRIQRERREAVALAIDSINVQLREHGIDMQFDATAFISK